MKKGWWAQALDGPGAEVEHSYSLIHRIAANDEGWAGDEARKFIEADDTYKFILANTEGNGRRHGDSMRGEAAGAVVAGVIGERR